MADPVLHGPRPGIITPRTLPSGEFACVATCVCGEEMPPARTATGARFNTLYHALSATRAQYLGVLDALDQVNSRGSRIDSIGDDLAKLSEKGVVKKVHTAPDDSVKVALSPSVADDFERWLDQRQCELSPPIPDGNGGYFHTVTPQPHVWESLMRNPRDET